MIPRESVTLWWFHLRLSIPVDTGHFLCSQAWWDQHDKSGLEDHFLQWTFGSMVWRPPLGRKLCPVPWLVNVKQSKAYDYTSFWNGSFMQFLDCCKLPLTFSSSEIQSAKPMEASTGGYLKDQGPTLPAVVIELGAGFLGWTARSPQGWCSFSKKDHNEGRVW